MENSRSPTSSSFYASVLILLLAVATIATAFPPFFFYTAGSDSSNYTAKSYIFRWNHESSQRFYPSRIPDEVKPSLNEAFTDLRGKVSPESSIVGMFTPFVFVTNNYEIELSHFRLYSWILGTLRFFPPSVHAAEYFNYFSLFVGIFFLFKIMHVFKCEQAASLSGCLCLLLVPSISAISQEPLTEITTFALHMGLIWTAMRGKIILSSLFITALMWTRGEYVFIALIFLGWLGYQSFRYFWSIIIILVSLYVLWIHSSVFNSYYIYSNDYLPYLMKIVLYSPIIVILGWFLSRILRADLPARLIRESSIKEPHKYIWIAILICFLLLVALDVYKVCIGFARYSTFKLLISSATLLVFIGIPFLLIKLPTLFKCTPILASILFIPQLWVLVEMGATPQNVFMWNRRFIPALYPLLALGVALFFSELSKARLPSRLVMPTYCSVFAIVVSGMIYFHFNDFCLLRTDLLTRNQLSQFDESVTWLPKDSVIILSNDKFSLKGSLPLRTRHGLWSYVLWNESKLEASIKAFLSRGYLVFIEAELKDTLRGERSFHYDESINQKFYVGESTLTNENRTIQLYKIETIG